MQLLGRRGLGIIVAAWLLAGCPRYAIQPPPRYTNEPPAESTEVTLAASARRSERPARPVASPSPTCIRGTIVTSGTAEIPVARARVTVVVRDTQTAEATTDDNGRFSWCTSRALEGPAVRASVRVEKAAFTASDREIDIPVGSTTELAIGLSPTS